jgi:hypothetical protein
MLIMIFLRVTCICLCLLTVTPRDLDAEAQAASSLQTIWRLDEQLVSSIVKDPHIQTFDLAPDGRILALLVESGSNVEAPLWLITEDIRTKQVVSKITLGSYAPWVAGFSRQVCFSGDQRFLVVQDLRQVRVLDAVSLGVVRTIESSSITKDAVPLFVSGAVKNDVFAIAFGSSHQAPYGLRESPAHIDFVDVSTGTRLGSFEADDVPQSVSADGKLVAISDWNKRDNPLGLSIFDATGHKLTTLNVGYSFKTQEPGGKPIGRVIGKFVSEDQILLTPDEKRDFSGHQAGDNLQLLSIPSGHLLQKISPKNYGPTGEIAVSANRQVVLVVSWHVPPRTIKRESALPASLEPELLLFKNDGNILLDAAVPIHGFGLKASGWMENRRPHVSADGSVIAIAQDDGVTILKRQ